MFDSSDVQSVFSGNIAEEWEKKSRYINSLNGNDNMMIPTIKKYITSTSKILEVGCGTGKLLSQIDALTFGIELTGVEMSSDMLQQIDTLRFVCVFLEVAKDLERKSFVIYIVGNVHEAVRICSRFRSS